MKAPEAVASLKNHAPVTTMPLCKRGMIVSFRADGPADDDGLKPRFR
jgi:hypothetical protein